MVGLLNVRGSRARPGWMMSQWLDVTAAADRRRRLSASRGNAAIVEEAAARANPAFEPQGCQALLELCGFVEYLNDAELSSVVEAPVNDAGLVQRGVVASRGCWLHEAVDPEEAPMRFESSANHRPELLEPRWRHVRQP